MAQSEKAKRVLAYLQTQPEDAVATLKELAKEAVERLQLKPDAKLFDPLPDPLASGNMADVRLSLSSAELVDVSAAVKAAGENLEGEAKSTAEKTAKKHADDTNQATKAYVGAIASYVLKR